MNTSVNHQLFLWSIPGIDWGTFGHLNWAMYFIAVALSFALCVSALSRLAMVYNPFQWS